MTRTSIEWVRNRDGSQGFTVNPIRFRNRETGKVGHYCEKVSPGCKNCYASRMQKGPYLSGLEFIAENKDRGELFFDDNVSWQVIRRRKPSTFFWCDCTDLFGPWVPNEWIYRIAAVCALTRQHRHLWLTKRADRMREYMHSLAEDRVDDVYDVATDIAHADIRNTAYLQAQADRLIDNWPLDNLGLGVSAEDQQWADERIPDLLQTPAAMRFVSLEPMLSDISFRWAKWEPLKGYPHINNEYDGLRRINWVIVGGESGPGARPMPPEWPRAIRDQCVAAGVPYFHKQNGEWATVPTETVTIRTRYEDVPIGDGTHHRMFPVGKKSAGRLLDGRTWDEMPEMLR